MHRMAQVPSSKPVFTGAHTRDARSCEGGRMSPTQQCWRRVVTLPFQRVVIHYSLSHSQNGQVASLGWKTILVTQAPMNHSKTAKPALLQSLHVSHTEDKNDPKFPFAKRSRKILPSALVNHCCVTNRPKIQRQKTTTHT